MRRVLIIFSILLISLVSLSAEGSSPEQQLATVPMTFENATGTAVSVLVASNDTFAPGIGGYRITQYEYFGFSIMLDDGSDSAIDVDMTIQVSPTGVAGTWEEYTQTCIYPAIEAATATLNINDEDWHNGSIQIAPNSYMKIVLDNNNADVDVTPTMWLTHQ